MRKLIPFTLFALSLSAASPSYVKTICSGGSGGCTGTPTAAGDLIVVHLADLYASGNATAVTAGATNLTAATGLTSCAVSFDTHIRYQQWYGYAPTNTSTTFSVTWPSGSGYRRMMVVEYSGAATSSPLDTGGASYNCSGGAETGTIDLGGVTTTGVNETVICGVATYSGYPVSLGTGFSNLVQFNNFAYLAAEDRAAATAGAYGTTIVSSGSDTERGGGCAAYIPAANPPDYSISGPASGYRLEPSSNFTITNLTGNWSSTPKTITISDGGRSGTVASCAGSGTAPYAISLSSGTTCTFTYKTAVTGSITLASSINSGVDPSPATYSYTSNPNACAAQTSANWSAASTWVHCSSTTPQSGDAVALSPYTVTMDVSATIASLNFGASGSLIVNTGVGLTVGNTTYGGSYATSPPTFQQQPGSTITFTAGATYQANDYPTPRPWSADCLGGTACTINASGGYAQLVTTAGAPANGFGNGLIWKNVHVSNLGDATHPGVTAVAPSWGSMSWDVENSTFTNCGRFNYDSASSGGTGNETFIWKGNRHTGTLSSNVLQIGMGTWSSGSRLIDSNDFDVAAPNGTGASCDGVYPLPHFTISNNIFRAHFCDTQPGSPEISVIGNIFLSGSPSVNAGTISQNVYLPNDNFGNPEGLAFISSNTSATRNLFVYPDVNGASDLGTGFHILSASGLTGIGIANNLLLGGTDGLQAFRFVTTQSPTATVTIDHNTVFGPLVEVGHSIQTSNNIHDGWLLEGRSNVMWWPVNTASGNQGAWKFTDIDETAGACSSYYSSSISSLALLGANVAWSPAGALPSAASWVQSPFCNTANQYDGYMANFSAHPPGTADLDNVNPHYADSTRNPLLWPIAYLGMSAATWAVGTTYNQGDYALDSQSGIFGGASVLYRCKTTTCATQRPGVGATAKATWEWGLIQRLADQVRAGTAYTDGAINCAACTPVQALIQWVQQGYIPTNPALWCAGHDGETSGAIPFCSKGKALIAVAGM